MKVFNGSCFAASSRDQLKKLAKSASDAIVTKTCTVKSIKNEDQIYEYDGFGSVNKIGLANRGFEYFRTLGPFKKPYIISLTGTRKELETMLATYTTADMFEFNVSCPNADVALEIIDLYTLKHQRPFGIKLPPYHEDYLIKQTAYIIKEFCKNIPLKYIVCCNTFRGVLGSTEGGVGGKYLQPLALWNVKKFREYLGDCPVKIYGCGGVSTAADVKKYIDAGADGVQVVTALIENGPGIFSKLKS